MFDSGIPGLPRLIALRGLGRFFGFTFFAICYLLGLLAFQAELMPDCLFVVEARAICMDAYRARWGDHTPVPQHQNHNQPPTPPHTHHHTHTTTLTLPFGPYI